jgi:putative transposase
MSVRTRLTEEQWSKVVGAIHAGPRGRGRPALDDRNFIEAVLWFHRAGAPWRDLPSEFGPWKTVFNRFDRWAKQERWARIFEALKTDIDAEWHSIDSTINRAHQHAAGAKGGLRSTRSDVPAVAPRPRYT